MPAAGIGFVAGYLVCHVLSSVSNRPQRQWEALQPVGVPLEEVAPAVRSPVAAAPVPIEEAAPTCLLQVGIGAATQSYNGMPDLATWTPTRRSHQAASRSQARAVG